MSKNILIIGGSSGIGLESAKYLICQGFNLYIAARTNPNIKEIKYHYIDVTNEESIENTFSYFKSLKLNLDALVYSTGITTAKKPIEQFNKTNFDSIININVTGAVLCLKYAYSLLKRSKGKVIIINSLASKTFSKFSGIEYTISKSALNGLVNQLSQEWAKDKILINSIVPSMVKTNMLKNTLSENEIIDLEKELPLKKLLEPIEIAKAIEFLIRNDYTTGSSINITGGIYLNG
ncbi:SDR family oxidoreductase [Halarcobacter anaerophilus]|uniref:SDR family oxidoreductase n=1 Tax=Halarcobacter anaerophilus TaxID=877500 RepID=UPI0005CB0745|nr:SDR family oxidoreductase [Halarcobacter anaerophilus]